MGATESNFDGAGGIIGCSRSGDWRDVLGASIPKPTVAAARRDRGASIRKSEPDPENAFFTDGVQDEILTDLAKIADLKVISRTSVMQYKTG